jgi:hypothetical protein
MSIIIVATNSLTIILGYFMICMGILCLIYLICSIRTNLVFFLIFFTLVPAFGLLAGAFFNAAMGKLAIAAKCQEAAGAFTFVTCMCGWYILLAIMLASVDFPFDLPRKLTSTSKLSCTTRLTLHSCRPLHHDQGREPEAQGRPRRVSTLVLVIPIILLLVGFENVSMSYRPVMRQLRSDVEP